MLEIKACGGSVGEGRAWGVKRIRRVIMDNSVKSSVGSVMNTLKYAVLRGTVKDERWCWRGFQPPHPHPLPPPSHPPGQSSPHPPL